MSTKNRLKQCEASEIKDTNERKVKIFIEDLIKHYKKINDKKKKKNIKKIRDSENNICQNDLMINMNQSTNILVKSYGPELYITTMQLDSINREGNFLKKHKISSVSRTKMVNWMMEIFSSYSSEPLTFFLSVNIMDMYLQKTKKVYTEENFQLIGMVTMFLASKMEDIIPLHMIHIKTKIGHDKFTEKQITKLEKEILKVLNWDIVLITTYDVIKTFLADFNVNNNEMIHNLKLEIIIYDIEIISIFLVKLISMHESFFKYSNCIKAIGIIIAAFDILRSNYNISQDAENFIRQWLLFLVQESKYSVEMITHVYNKICRFYEDINNVNKIAPSLCKLHNLKNLIKDIK